MYIPFKGQENCQSTPYMEEGANKHKCFSVKYFFNILLYSDACGNEIGS